ncbi:MULTISPECIES: hypothetical protein [Pseudomonas]|uniref:hypothetical protein n=1 Tax=Pseudomonas TaxID=286 RepID=UPI000B155EDF|nr:MULTISPECIES: hypothetical protein [Pseudomonas]EKP5707852.1 hypothetical protein [Pseudomonas aeruginosa]EKU3772482.1 hypothetical protein [Pseudomonas aeruginosa]EKV2940902.1 hypothetical protein [Pseudomonas aeruginosa]EKV8087424.1 hypothetical protein [Pseudomonas aeruginosa]EKW5156796.1 hypothetical protein [Pseudomonas aeruginosa]
MNIEENPIDNPFTIRKRINNELSEIVPKLWPEETHRTLKELIIQAGQEKKLTLANAKKLWKSDPITETIKSTPNNGNTLFESYIMATLYNSKIKINQDVNLGYNFSCLALYHLGKLAWQLDIIENHERYQKLSASGGKAKSQGTELINQKIIQLLNTPPQDGWTTKTSTADLLEKDVDKFILETNLGKHIYNTRDFIERALHSNTGIKDAFNKNKKTRDTKK